MHFTVQGSWAQRTRLGKVGFHRLQGLFCVNPATQLELPVAAEVVDQCLREIRRHKRWRPDEEVGASESSLVLQMKDF